MDKSLFFYDLETSGLSARSDRVLQFAGQRTDMELNLIGEPVNVLIRLNDDTIPNPESVMVTGITPQKTLEEGYTEAEFCKMLVEDWFTPNTTIVGFNNVRFDDEFIRHTLWRNFHDPYEWAWKDGRSRWDLLDVSRMVRALRPEGISWPVDENGDSVNKLELITEANGISHESAHDALSDVQALIDLAKLIKQKQPQMFDYLLNMRNKRAIQNLVNLDDKKPFVYTSGRYDKQFEKTTVAFPIAPAANSGVVVYDLRYDPTEFFKLSQDEIEAKIFATWEERQAENFVPLPVKALRYNKCPTVAPVGVLEHADSWSRLSLDRDEIKKNMNLLLSNHGFMERIRTAYEKPTEFAKSDDPESRLYDSFVPEADKFRIEAVRNANEGELADFHPDFQDERLPDLLLHYKARNFPRSLSEDEMITWEEWRSNRLQAQLPKVVESIQKLSTSDLSSDQQFALSEIQLWIENILPVES